LLLLGAIVCEVTASLSLKAALHEPHFYAMVVVGYLASCGFLTGVLRRGMAIGVAYGIWGAIGVAATALMSALLFGEALTPIMGLGMGLIVVGVLVIEFGSHAATRHRRIPGSD
jgi:small multidrug resistance pump